MGEDMVDAAGVAPFGLDRGVAGRKREHPTEQAACRAAA